MDTKEGARKTRLKSTNSDSQAANESQEEEMAPNQNGNNDSTSANEATTEEDDSFIEETKKRKLDETDDETNANNTIEEVKNDEMNVSSANEPKGEDVSNGATPEIQDDKLLLGKGKRARVPNKRYSDILPTRMRTETPKGKQPENGRLTDSEVVKEDEPSVLATPPPSKKPRTAARPDISDPRFLKPFKYGWKRELVLRAEYDVTQKRSGDIYYYTPMGKKIRSIRELLEILAKVKDLTKDNFTFLKEPLGLNDPNKEIIREAKVQGQKKKALDMKKGSPSKTTPKSKPKGTVTKVADSSKLSSDTKSTKSPRVGTFKVKLPKSTSKDKRKGKEEEEKDDSWAQSKKSKSSSYNSNERSKPCRPCSIQCDGVLGLIPTLQCRICLCLYHNECVGLPTQTVVQGYVCKNCQLDHESTNTTSPKTATKTPTSDSSPPKLTPINAIQTTTPPSSIPKLQRIPSLTAESTSPDLTNKLTVIPTTPTNLNESKSILGSVTTWFPASSTIQVGNNADDGELSQQETSRPQLVEFIGKKKYLVIPRRNIVSVAPSVANTTICSDTTNNQLNDDQCDNNNVISDKKVDSDERNSIEVKPVVVPVEKESNDDVAVDSAVEAQNNVLERSEPAPASPSPVTSVVAAPSKSKQVNDTKDVSSKFMETYMQNVAYGYKTLLCVFQYLKVADLLRAGCVCTMWRDVSRHPSLWNIVRMKNSQVHNFDGLANALKTRATTHLDLRKMLLPSGGNDDIWPSFIETIKKVDGLRKVELCRCLASVVEDLARNNPNLEVINAITIKCDSMTFESFSNLKNLTDLRIKSTAGLTLTSDLSSLKELTKLKQLSITSIKEMDKLNLEVIGELVNLEALDLGECTDFPKHFGSEILSKLVNLEKLRLEKGQGECYTFEILDAVKDLTKLQQLELVNFDIKAGFDNALGACSNIKKLLLIPTYISQSATTNHMVLGGVLKLQKTLAHFVWGVTLELLRVTELFVDQCEQPKSDGTTTKNDKSGGDSIPVLKPVPLQGIAQVAPTSPSDTPQVEILPLPNLQKLLLQNLPTTRVKILKIPFHATWRQSITDNTS